MKEKESNEQNETSSNDSKRFERKPKLTKQQIEKKRKKKQ
jgi:hypothetical protein